MCSGEVCTTSLVNFFGQFIYIYTLSFRAVGTVQRSATTEIAGQPWCELFRFSMQDIQCPVERNELRIKAKYDQRLARGMITQATSRKVHRFGQSITADDFYNRATQARVELGQDPSHRKQIESGLDEYDQMWPAHELFRTIKRICHANIVFFYAWLNQWFARFITAPKVSTKALA
jgi:hypothetical protein